MELNKREAQRAIIERMKDYTLCEEFNLAELRILKFKENLLKQAFQKYREEHDAILEKSVDPRHLDVQNEAYFKVQETFLMAQVTIAARIDDIEFQAESDMEKEREKEKEEAKKLKAEQEELERQERLNQVANDRSTLSGVQNEHNGSDGQNIRRARIENDEFLLDRFKPPKFNGIFSKWSEWKSSFDSMVHNTNLTHTRKLYLLKQCLIGNAERLLAGWQVVGENYQEAYHAVCEVYDNMYRIKMAHLDELH